MAKSKAQTTKAPKFEEAIEQLESIIEKVESGQIGLEESLSQYERGMKLVKQCRQILDTAERRIGELSVDGSGRLKSDEAGYEESSEQQPQSLGGAEPQTEDDERPFE